MGGDCKERAKLGAMSGAKLREHLSKDDGSSLYFLCQVLVSTLGSITEIGLLN
jgi:hypothetical protein